MRKILKVFSALLVPIVFIGALFAGCKKQEVEIDNSGIMNDIDVPPEQKAAYEQYSKEVIAQYKEVAEAHTVDGDTDHENEEVIKAANAAAAKLYAYACYNERTLDKYVYFSDQQGDTDLGSTGSATARRQEYYLRVNEGADTCGYRYHYTIKKVVKSEGLVSASKSLFESARIRFTDKTNLLYRFEGKNIRVGEEEHEKLGCTLLECDWETGKDWGKPDIEMKKSDFIAPEDIEADIVASAGEDNITIRGNINILAENIVKSSLILDDGEGGYLIRMTVDTDVANADEASMKMLRKANDSKNCEWRSVDEDDTGLTIVFRIWGNGLFRFYSVSERWSGNISMFSGTAESYTTYNYSYSDRDCSMIENLEMLEKANADRG